MWLLRHSEARYYLSTLLRPVPQLWPIWDSNCFHGWLVDLVGLSDSIRLPLVLLLHLIVGRGCYVLVSLSFLNQHLGLIQQGFRIPVPRLAFGSVLIQLQGIQGWLILRHLRLIQFTVKVIQRLMINASMLCDKVCWYTWRCKVP